MKKVWAIVLAVFLALPALALDQKTIDLGIASVQDQHSRTGLLVWGGIGIEVIGLGMLVAGLLPADRPNTPLLAGGVILGGGGGIMSISASSRYMAEKSTLMRYQYVDAHFGTLAANDADDIWAGSLRIGTTPEVARAIMGDPQSINVTQMAGVRHEQWVYSLTTYLYFENGLLTAMQY